jgi:CRP-like cAMP-binding protein
MDAERLRSIPLFEGLSAKEREHVARLADEVDVQAGKELVVEGEFGWEFFVIESGGAEVRRGDELFRTLGPGDFFGELALISEERRTASVTATEASTLIVMTRQAFDTIERELPEVAERLRERFTQYRF